MDNRRIATLTKALHNYRWRMKLILVLVVLLLIVPAIVLAADPPEFILKWGSIGSGNDQLRFPRTAAVDSAGNIYVADTGNYRIQVFDQNGAFLRNWYGFLNPYGVAVDSADNVYVADTFNHQIQVFDSSGAFIRKWGSNGTEDGQFSSPHDLVVDSANYVYVADQNNSRIQVFTSTGTFIRKWGTYGFGNGQFKYPSNIALDSLGRVYVTDGNHRVQVFDSTGTFIRKWGYYGSADGYFKSPRGVAVDSQNRIYVADESNHRIQVFDSNGGFLFKWGSNGSGDGQFTDPWGVAIDSEDNIYVTGTSLSRVQKFGYDTNEPPTADAGGPYSGSESNPIPLDGSGSSDDLGIALYEWDCENDGVYDVSSATPTGSSCTYADDGSYTAGLRVTDDEGLAGEDTAVVSVANGTPTVAVPTVSPEPSHEGSLATASAAFSDFGFNDSPFTCTVDYGEGDGPEVGSVSSNTCAGPAHTYDDNGSYMVTVAVTDKDGGTGSKSTAHTVNNVTPSVDAGVDQTVLEDTTVSLDPAEFTDPGVLDEHTWTIDWGDTTGESGIVTPGGRTVPGSHIYEDPGPYTVTITVEDNAGDNDSDTLTISVVNGFLGYCAYAEEKDLKAEEKAHLDCSAGSEAKTEIKKEVYVGGDIISFDKEVKIGENATVDGNVTADAKVEVKKNATINKSVLSGKNISLKQQAFVGGDATAAGKITMKSSAVVLGTKTEGATVVLPPQPAALSVSVSAGGPDVKVDKGVTLNLAADSYGKLKVEETATLILNAGEYAFEEIEVKKEATINIILPQTTDTIIISVKGKVKMAEGTQMNISGDGGAENILFIVEGSKVELKKEGSYLGTFIAPEADIKVEEKAALEGALYGEKVELKKETTLIGAPAIDLFASVFVAP